MDYLDGVARKLEPRIYDEDNPYDREDGEMSDFNGELEFNEYCCRVYQFIRL